MTMLWKIQILLSFYFVLAPSYLKRAMEPFILKYFDATYYYMGAFLASMILQVTPTNLRPSQEILRNVSRIKVRFEG